MSSTGYVLKWVFGPKPGVEIVLKPGLLCIGRGSENDKRYGWLLLPDPTVSRHHANLHWLPADHRFMIEHLSQTNPTLVNDKPMAGTQLLNQGARLQIGFSKFVLDRRYVSMPSFKVPAAPAKAATDRSAHTLQMLPDGYTQVLDKTRPNTIGLNVVVLWMQEKECFYLNRRGATQAVISRRQGQVETILSLSDGPAGLEDGDLISVDYCQFRYTRIVPQIEVAQDLSVEFARTFALPGFSAVAMLGSGATGEVIEMRNQENGYLVAVKFLRSHLAAEPGTIGRFKREAEVACLLRHPALLKVYQAGIAPNGRPFLVSELLRGQTLAQRLASHGPATSIELVAWASDLAEGLDYLHLQDLVHRDAKPENIFLRQEGGAVLLDFGIVRGADITATQTGFAMGTPHYMAPEQFRGYPLPSSDQYALGAVLFEALTGRRLFETNDPMSLGYLHVHEAPPDLRELRPDLSAATAQVLSRMLLKSPDARFSTAREAIRHLRHSLGL